MRTLLLLTGFVFCFGYSHSQNYKQRKEKIKALKVAYITETLNLSSSEAEKFWPIYNTSESKRNSLKRKIKTYRRNYANSIETMSESEARKHLENLDKCHEDLYLIHKETKNMLLKVMSAKKVLLLKKAEDEFNMKMIEEFKKRRKGAPKSY